MMIGALHCLNSGLHSVLDQFTINMFNSLFSRRQDNLPLSGLDLFWGRFQESIETKVKPVKATNKINLKELQAYIPKAAGKIKKRVSFVIPRLAHKKRPVAIFVVTLTILPPRIFPNPNPYNSVPTGV